MADVAPVHGTPTPNVHPGIKGFMTKDLAGMPTWVWILIVGAGITAVYIIPKFFGTKSASQTTPTSGLGLAIDPTTGLPYAVEGLVPSGGTVGGNNTPPIPPGPPPNPPPPVFVWPTALTGMEIWQGTSSHNFFFGPHGPQPHEKDQTLLSTLFPAGTTFQDVQGTGGAKTSFSYTIPGQQPVIAPVTLVDPNASAHTPAGGGFGGLHVNVLEPAWPGNTHQRRRM
jgi:hypothetical protein